MEQDQELQPLNNLIMAAKLEKSSSNEPESWYKDVLNAGEQQLTESLSHSEDELNTSHGRYLATLMLDYKSLTASQTKP